TSLRGSEDVFVTRLSASGSALSYSTYLGGVSFGGQEEGLGIAADRSSRAYVVGWTNSGNFPTTSGAYDTTLGSGTGFGQAACGPRLEDGGGSLGYSPYLGGAAASSSDTATGVALDASNNAYVSGYTNATDFPTTAGAYQGSLAGSGTPPPKDAFLTKV